MQRNTILPQRHADIMLRVHSEQRSVPDNSQVPPVNFDRIAPQYDRLERLFSRGLMHRARIAHLGRINQCRHALLLGEGPGRFLPLVDRQFPDSKITYVDSSPQMLELARSASSKTDRECTTFIETDIRSWELPADRYDLIVTNFFLDCFDQAEIARIIPVVASAATDDANWLIADFNVPERGFARWRAEFITGILYQFFRFATGLSARKLLSPQPWLEECGFQLRRRIEFDHGLLRSDWWSRATTSE